MFAEERGVELSKRSDQRERSAATAPGSRLSYFAEFTCDKVLRGVLTKKYGYVLQCEEDWRFPAPSAGCHKFAALLSVAKFELKLCLQVCSFLYWTRAVVINYFLIMCGQYFM